MPFFKPLKNIEKTKEESPVPAAKKEMTTFDDFFAPFSARYRGKSRC
tara:strand:- start:220 stop:360 length:141 start_codon:yes stop_codon:yes gene_type:complete